jgi:hypothetical protein
MQQTFETFIAQERERLAKAREAALARKKEVEDELGAIDREIFAIAAYEQAKRGKSPATPRASRQPGRRGKRETVLEEVKKHPDGITRAELLEVMNFKGDKSGEQFVSNALSALKRDGRLNVDGKKYLAA